MNQSLPLYVPNSPSGLRPNPPSVLALFFAISDFIPEYHNHHQIGKIGIVFAIPSAFLMSFSIVSEIVHPPKVRESLINCRIRKRHKSIIIRLLKKFCTCPEAFFPITSAPKISF